MTFRASLFDDRTPGAHHASLFHEEEVRVDQTMPPRTFGRHFGKRLVTAALCSIGLMLVLYAALLGGSEKKSAAVDDASRLRGVNQNYVNGPSGSTAAQLDVLEKSALNAHNCPHRVPVTETPGKPVWIAGYPGSGFDLVAPLISAVTGLTSVDIYRQHSCSVAIQEGAAPTGACLSHWPLVQLDSPAAVAVATGTFYNPRAVFVLRNPADAIPSYHTRWWGAQRHIRGNHDQPDWQEWIEWRDRRFDKHLQIWKTTLKEWQRGVPVAGIAGISLYLPYEQLIDASLGPALTDQLAAQFTTAHHPTTAANTACLWRRIVDDVHHAPKVYQATYTGAQKEQLLQTLDSLALKYATTEPKLTEILAGYRDEIADDLPLDEGE